MKKILAFSGSMSNASINHSLIEFTANMIDNAEVSVIRLLNFEAPLYSAERENEDGIPEGILRLRVEFDKSDAFILSTPEYNGSIPGGLKNTIDWLSRTEGKTFQDKPVFLMATSPGARGGSSVLGHLSAILPFWGAQLIGPFSFPSFHQNFIDGKMNAELKDTLQEHLDSLLDTIK
ncbi:MAG: chromate reductase [Bacteroidia bacterium]|jgi:chromate reductase